MPLPQTAKAMHPWPMLSGQPAHEAGRDDGREVNVAGAGNKQRSDWMMGQAGTTDSGS